MVNNDPKYLWSTFDDAWISFLCNSGHRLKAIILSIFVVHKEEPEKKKLFVTSVEMKFHAIEEILFNCFSSIKQ